MKKAIFFLFAFTVFLTSCLFDNREEFYPEEEEPIVTTVSFATDVFPIVQAECISCHGATSPSGGVSLHTYAKIKTSVDDGSFYDSLIAANGYRIMPTSGPLPDTQIQTINTWIQEGALDN